MYENQTFDVIIERMLGRVPDSFDKREGSVIYDALAPAAMELCEAYIALDDVIANTFPGTCSRDFLLQFAAEKDMQPIAATPAVVKIVSTPSYVEVPLESVLSIGNYNYTVTAKIADGEYEATCDTPGSEGSVITADMDVIPVVEITGLETIEFAEVLDEGTDEEDTEHFRQRYIDSLKPYAFGGNVADYKVKTLSIDGVGACHVMRAGDVVSGQPIPGGYVNVIIMDNAYDKASTTLINKVQDILDPAPGFGAGLAPIGHSVTVSTVQYTNITVSMNLETSNGVVDEGVEAVIRATIEQYFVSLRKNWEKSEGIVVRRSQAEGAIYSLNNVVDCEITELKITGSSDMGHILTLPITDIPKLDVLNVTPAN